ncbi:hypothetical protein MJH12_11850 [bacterium]|nr:hypothetical protein [bacterium]
MDLLIDTVSQGLRLALISNNNDFHYLSLDKSCSHSLLKILEDELNQIQKSSSDIERVFFNRGPGSFTGIKMGYVTAMTFALDSAVKVYSYTSFDLMYTQISGNKHQKFLLNAFQGDYFVAQKEDNRWDYKVVSSQAIIESEEMYFMGIDKYDRDCFETIEGFDSDIFQKMIEQKCYSKDTQPLYLKKSTAEIARDKKRAIQN